MFIVKPKTAEDLQQAMFICSYYRVQVESYSDGEHAHSVMLSVKANDEHNQGEHHSPKEAEEAFHLCELAFQMNFRQDNHRICDLCKEAIEKLGEGEAVCGHLTFTQYVGS